MVGLGNEQKNNSNKIYIVLFLYWFILVVWQNITSAQNKGMLDVVLKVGLLGFLFICFLLNSKGINQNKFVYILLALTCFCLTAVVEKRFSLGVAVSYLFPLIFAFLCYCVGDDFCITEKHYLRYLNLIIFATLYMVGYSFIFDFGKFKSALSISSAYGNELSSFFSSNHEYAMYLVFAIAGCLICLIKGSNTKFKKAFYLISIALFLSNLILTYSRTAMLACAVMITIFAVFDKSWIKKLIIFAVIILALVVVCSSTLQNYIFQILLKGNNDAGRSELIDVALSKFKGGSIFNKLFGFGYTETANYLVIETTHESVHNAYLNTLLTNGIAGLSILVCLVINNIVQAIKFIKVDRFYGAIFSGLAFSIAFFMLTNTAVIFNSPIDSSMMTVFAIIVPKFVRNAVFQSFINGAQKD